MCGLGVGRKVGTDSALGESAGLVLLWTDVLSRHLEGGMFTCERTYLRTVYVNE